MCILIVSHYGFLILVGNGGYCIHSFCCSRAWDVIEFPKLKSWYQQNLELIELIMQSLETLTNLTQYQILKTYLEIQYKIWIEYKISSAHLIDYCQCQLFWSYCPPCEFPGFEVTVHLVILDIDGFLSFHFVLSRWIGCPIFSSSTAYLTALLCHMRGYLIALLCFTLPYERRGDVNVVFNSIQGCLQLLL